MRNRLYAFLGKNELIYSFQFALRQKHSTTHALIHLTEKLENSWMMVIMVAGFLSTFRKHLILQIAMQVLLKKLEHNGIRGISNNCFPSYLSNRIQFMSINGFNLNLTNMKYGLQQGSILSPLLFFDLYIYIYI